MPRHIPQYLKLGPKSTDSSDVIRLIHPDEVQALEHSTILPGGFHKLKLIVASSELDYWTWRYARPLARILIDDASGHQIWEGRLEDVALIDPWLVELGFFGYWSNLTDAVVSSVSYDQMVDSIISDLLTNQMPDDTRQISIDSGYLATGPRIVQTYEDATVWSIIQDVIRYGSSNNLPMEFAIWEDRVARYWERTISAVTWFAEIGPDGGVEVFTPRTTWRTVANAVLAVYGNSSRTSYAEDDASIAAGIRREMHLTNLGSVSVTVARQRRDSELRSRSQYRQESTGLQISRVWDSQGIEWPICRVRAGDVLNVRDFVPGGSQGTRTLNGLNTFYVQETKCNHVTGRLTVTPDFSGPSVERVLNDILTGMSRR